MVTKLLQWLHGHRSFVWPLVFVYTLAVTFPHLIVQNWVRAGTGTSVAGLSLFYRRMAMSAAVLVAILTISYLLALKKHPARRDLLLAWAGTLSLSYLAWTYLSVNNSELIHFLQYAIPGVVLIALTHSVTDSLAWLLIMAGFDEGYQFWGINPTWGIPWDFNDIVMDLLGGAIGIFFGLGFLRTVPARTPNWRRPGILTLASIYATGALLLATGFVRLYEDKADPNYWFSLSRMRNKSFWFYDATWGPRTVHTIAIEEGLVIVLLILALYSLFDRRHEVSDL